MRRRCSKLGTHGKLVLRGTEFLVGCRQTGYPKTPKPQFTSLEFVK